METHTFSLINILKKNLKSKELAELNGGSGNANTSSNDADSGNVKKFDNVVNNNTYPCLIPDSTRAKGNKGNRCWECMPCSYWNLIAHFNQRTIDALVKLTRLSFDYLRRRMQPASRYTSAATSTASKAAPASGNANSGDNELTSYRGSPGGTKLFLNLK